MDFLKGIVDLQVSSTTAEDFISRTYSPEYCICRLILLRTDNYDLLVAAPPSYGTQLKSIATTTCVIRYVVGR